MADSLKATVATPCDAYNEMVEDWDLVSDLLGGTKAMRNAGPRWLPQEAAESSILYQARLNRTILFNGFRRAVRTLVGKPFSRPIQLQTEGMDAKVKEWTEDIDLTGRHLDLFSRDGFFSGISYGKIHILVDYPRVPQGSTLYDEREIIKARPYAILIDPRNVIGWESTLISGKEVLTQVRIKEKAVVKEGDWLQRKVNRVRVLYIGRFELYEETEKKDGSEETDWIKIDEGTTTLNRIPLITIYTHKTGFMTSCPPLLDLAYLNVQHWQSSSDQAHILHIARVPILFGSGIVASDEEAVKLVIGANRFIHSTNPSASLTYVEHSGAAIGAGQQDLENIENRMAIMGADLLAKRSVTMTATQSTLDELAEDSDLGAMVRCMEDGIDEMLQVMAEWVGMDPKKAGEVQIYKDFAISMRDAQDLNTLLAARTAGDISQARFIKECQRRGVIDPGADVDDEIAEAKLSAPEPLVKEPGVSQNELDNIAEENGGATQ